MAVWETEDESSGPAAATLPTPQDTPYRTPSNGSKRSRRSTTPPGMKGSSPPLQLADKGNSKQSKQSSRDVSNDDNISVLDPRRFTPTLHANLVAEILNLRRDQEEKIKLIENLETSLDSNRQEKESLQESLVSTSKDARSLKRQLSLLEGGTSSALGELARERDEAVESIADARKRLEVAQRKIRHQEEDSQRVHDLWTQEKESWLEEKRKYERKVHVAESRLKVVLGEVAAYQDVQANGDSHGHDTHGAESEVEDGAKDDNASIRTMSMTNSVRFSTTQSPGKNVENTLADELNLDGDDDWQTDDGGRESVLSNRRHTRNMSRDSVVSRFHQRNQSFESLKRPGSVARGRLWANQPVLEALEDGFEDGLEEEAHHAPKVSYTDTGIQPSPPPSPSMPSSKPATPEAPAKAERQAEVGSSPRAEFEIEANQRRKRVQLVKPSVAEPLSHSQCQMVSAGSQTVELPTSPPNTPEQSHRSLTPPPAETKPPMISASTQTEPEANEPDNVPEEKQSQPEIPPVPQLPIPSISVIPPTSRPTTPKQSLLPQYNKDFGCQVSLGPGTTTHSVGVQTEEIRIDHRLAQLPDHLRPDAISSRPPTPNLQTSAADEPGNQFTPPGQVPPRNPRRLTHKRSFPDSPARSPPPIPPVSPTLAGNFSSSAPGLADDIPLDTQRDNNDDEPLSSQKALQRHPPRISSLFAGFDGNSSDEADDYADADLSDTEYRTALTAPGQRPVSTVVRPSKQTSPGATSSPDQPKQLRHSALPRTTVSTAKALGTESYSYSLESKETTKDKEPSPQRPSTQKSTQRSHDKASSGANGKTNGMRKAAMIQSGIASHQGQGQGRSRSPSLPEARYPPFPIPTRASSRRPPISASAPSDGQRSPTRMDGMWQRRGSSRNSYRSNSIRKVRSAAALPRHHQRYRRQGSRSPPPFSETTETPESPGLPPLPQNDITTPRQFRDPSRSRYRSSHRSQPSTNTARTTQTNQTNQTNQTSQTNQTNQTNNTDVNSASSAAPAVGVVDAIAQAMVGEWMFKYVRRRKSFNPSESAGKDDSSNDRHKRWVWLAPYERAILWSSKQPSSGSALMGKTGRKLTIQSVLDVKDDNPTPKGGVSIFNRSILILTPQRALKFTATSAERHYIWLTALSFLAHSQQDVPEIVAAPPPPKAIVPDFEMPAQPLKRKPGIRDSIRLTKSKAPTFNKTGPPSIPSIPDIPSNQSAPSSQMGETSSFHDVGNNFNKQEAFPPLPEIESFHQREQSGDAAEPPMIPRFHDRANQVTVHGRKRSNTGGHVPPPLSFRGFSGPATTVGTHSYTNSNAANSVGTNGSSDIYQSQPSQASSGAPSWGMSTGGSQRTSEASSRPSNFFDAIGTVRMEAFISPLSHSQFDVDPDEHDEFRYRARRRSKELRRRASRSRHRDSYNSRGTRGTDDSYGGVGRIGAEDDFFRDDPFRGF